MQPAPMTGGGTVLATIAFLTAFIPVGGAPARGPAALGPRAHILVWTDRGEDPAARGQAVRVYFRADQDAYVTILRVDTDGRVRALFPREPWEDNFARSGREYEVPGSQDRSAFFVDDYPGVGYVFAVSAPDPFVYDAITSGDQWDYRVIADGRVRGDPYVALTDLAARIVPAGERDWDYDVVPYYVQQHYQYPRFLCYDCHSFVSYPSWSPYDYSCVRFRIVAYDDPSYYPYRYYGDTRVVLARPLRPEPRFIFTDRRSAAEPAFTRVRERPETDDRGRDVGVRDRDRDLGVTGVIPPPHRREPLRERPGASAPQERLGPPDRPGSQDRRRSPEGRDRPNRPAPRAPLARREPRGVVPREELRPAPVEDTRWQMPRTAPPPAPNRREPRAQPSREPPSSSAPPTRAVPHTRPRPAPSQPPPRSEPELKRRKP